MSKRSAGSPGDDTQPSEIPTAVFEENPFSEDSHTEVEDATLEVTPTTGPSARARKEIDKFRRPTHSEIIRAVDQVNTEAVDMEALARARAEQEDDDSELDIEVVIDDDEP